MILEEALEKIKRGEDRTDWARINKMTDKDIVYDEDSPKLTAKQLKGFKRVNPVGRPKSDNPLEGVYLRLEPDTAKALRAIGPKWQVRLRDQIKSWVRAGVLA
jgi:uncharacterized protein (DUF4415 family)